MRRSLKLQFPNLDRLHMMHPDGNTTIQVAQQFNQFGQQMRKFKML